jgi:hypothetical protein
MEEKGQIPDGYRQSITTAITVSLGFSLTFLQTFWRVKEKGGWTIMEVVSELVIVTGILLQVAALFRALHVLDNRMTRYMKTVRCFEAGIIVVISGVMMSIYLR